MNNLRAIRKEKKLRQVDIANYLKIDRTTYVKYETGTSEPDNNTLQKLADFFNCSIDFLLDRTYNPKPELVIPDELKGVQIAFHRGEFEDLTQDEIDALAVLAKTLREQREKKDREKEKN